MRIDAPRFSPSALEAEQVQVIILSMMEEAFGYRGNLKFLMFGFSLRTGQFAYCDGGDQIPTDRYLWLHFIRKPSVTLHNDEVRYPTLHGKLSNLEKNAGEALRFSEGRGDIEDDTFHSFLLDREGRKGSV
jgi:hypothetical protein